jgi:hypothetical protein
MAEVKLDDVKVVMGRMIEVYNTDRKSFSNANKTYIALQVEDASGDHEECLLFTKKEIERARYRASRNLEDQTKKCWMVDLID